MDTGRKSFQRDDYNARMQALADELGKGDAVYDEQLMKEIFKLDRNALNSWLTPERANSLRGSGHITVKQEGEIASAFASAYNHGDLPSATLHVGINPNVGAPEASMTLRMSTAWSSATPAIVETRPRTHRKCGSSSTSSARPILPIRHNFARSTPSTSSTSMC